VDFHIDKFMHSPGSSATPMRVPADAQLPRHLWGNLELWLIQPIEFDTLPDGTALVCIDGTIAVKGKDRIDGDTRYGSLAYGFLKIPENE
jgi:hypothetical protein